MCPDWESNQQLDLSGQHSNQLSYLASKDYVLNAVTLIPTLNMYIQNSSLRPYHPERAQSHLK